MGLVTKSIEMEMKDEAQIDWKGRCTIVCSIEKSGKMQMQMGDGRWASLAARGRGMQRVFIRRM